MHASRRAPPHGRQPGVDEELIEGTTSTRSSLQYTDQPSPSCTPHTPNASAPVNP